jgi:hypothetical protein
MFGGSARMMRSILAACGLALSLAACQPGAGPGFSSAAYSAPSYDRSFELYNNSYNTIVYVRASPSSSSYWSDDILGRDVLYPGESLAVNVPPGSGSDCYYDIQITDETGRSYDYYEIDLCSVYSLSFP